MFVDFNLIPKESRIWVYQASRRFTDEEQAIVQKQARSFCEQWAVHGKPLTTSFRIDHHQFLIFAMDESVLGPSGCSIDGSIHMLKGLHQQTGIDFLDRTKVAFLVDHEVWQIALSDLKDTFASGTLGPASRAFNVLAPDKQTWETHTLVAAEKTWLARFLPKIPVS